MTIAIDLECSDVISYAATHNGRPFVQHLSVQSDGGAAGGALETLDRLGRPEVRANIQKLAVELLATEGDLHPLRFARMVGLAHGLQRVVSRRSEQIAAVPLEGVHRDAEGFLMSGDGGADLGWKRSRSGSGREIAEILLRELCNAMRAVALVGLGATPDDLARLTGQALGVTRLTAGIRARLDAALADALRRGIVAERSGYIVASEPPACGAQPR